ncbi:MAG: tetratricopeptide repeat protein [candidate division Zixibacteria bacterium]|nr:tetratricopeptide repeat protein [candidate division Zixibacteria bacterium]
MSQEENNSLENSQEIRDNSESASSGNEETKVAIKEEIEETPAPPQAASEPASSGEEKVEDKTDKVKISDIEIQSPIDAMIEKTHLDSQCPENMTGQKLTEKKPKRTRNSRKRSKAESASTGSDPETGYRIPSELNKLEAEPTRPDTLSRTRPLEEQKISCKGVAHFKDNVIKIAGGFRLHAGDEMKIGDREFELKHLEPSKKPLYWGILALGIIVLFFIFQSSFTGPKDSGKMVGVVVEKGTGVFLPNAMIELKELGKKVQSNDLGFFIIDLLPAGTYQMQAQLKGYTPVSENAAIVKKQITTTVVELSPQTALSSPAKAEPERSEPRTRPVAPSQPRSTLGSVKIETNVPGVIVYLDGRYLGVGNNLYADIAPGTHSIRLSKDSYQDWTGSVAVSERSTSRIKVNLNSIESTSGSSSSTRGQTDFMSSAQKEYDIGNYAGAVENYTKGLLLDPGNPEAYLGRGSSYAKIGEKSKAIADLSQGAKLFENKGNYNKAVLCYSQVLNLTPGDLNYLYSRGQDYVHTGEYDKATADLKKVTEQNPKYLNGFMELGNAQYNAQDFKGAAESYTKARKLSPNSRQIYVNLAMTYTALENKSEAKKNYGKFKELTTLADRETMKDDPEWIKVLKFLGESTEKEF